MPRLIQLFLVLGLLGAGIECVKDIKHLTYTFEVDNNQEFCLFQRFNHSIDYIVEYGVLRGGNLDINFYLEVVQSSTRLHSEPSRKQKNVFTFTSSLNADYKFCFDNKFSTLTRKIAFLDLKPAKEKHLANLREEAAPDDHDVKPFVMSQHEFILDGIHTLMNNVSRIQDFYKHHEKIDRSFADTLNERVTIVSAFGLIAIVSSSIIQVYVVKQFFANFNKTSLMKQARF